MNPETLNLEPVIAEIRSLTTIWEPVLASLSEDAITRRRNSQNRTVRQILGHLVDSASNNIHRIVHLQYQPSPLTFPNYATEGNNDRWIAIQDYQHENWRDIILLWKYTNLHLCHVLGNVRTEKLANEWVSAPGKTITLGAMIGDYPRHLKLHLSEIEELAGAVPC